MRFKWRQPKKTITNKFEREFNERMLTVGQWTLTAIICVRPKIESVFFFIFICVTNLCMSKTRFETNKLYLIAKKNHIECIIKVTHCSVLNLYNVFVSFHFFHLILCFDKLNENDIYFIGGVLIIWN